MPISRSGLLELNYAQLLQSLVASRLFDSYFNGASLYDFVVTIMPSVLPATKAEPDASDEAEFVQVKGTKTLSAARVVPGASAKLPLCIRVERLPSASHGGSGALARLPDLPPPLSFTPVDLGGQQWLEAFIAQEGCQRPVFLTPTQHQQLVDFIDTPPHPHAHHLLMPVGTIKSDKTTVVRDVLPGLIAAAFATRWPKTRRKPVLFHFQFDLGATAAQSAQSMRQVLQALCARVGVPFAAPGTGLVGLADAVADCAQRVHAAGGELWLLLDELQAPGLAPTTPPADVLDFTMAVKKMVELCAPFARIAATGSGLITLLNALRIARVNGFSLWDSIKFVPIGQQPSAATASAMAQRIISSTASLTTGGALPVVTADDLIGSLKAAAATPLTSYRPALMAHIMQLIASGEPSVAAARAIALQQLEFEAERDAGVALSLLKPAQRIFLRDLAAGRFSCAQLARDMTRTATAAEFVATSASGVDGTLAKLITCLQESDLGSDMVRLQPPYGAVLQRWITKGGVVAVSTDTDDLQLGREITKNLVFLWEHRSIIDDITHRALSAAFSRAVMLSFASDGIGVPGPAGRLRPPATPAEFMAVPALAALRQTTGASLKPGQFSRLDAFLDRYDQGRDAQGRYFSGRIGKEALLACTQLRGHIWQTHSPLIQSGFTPAVLGDALFAGMHVLAHPRSGCFSMTADMPPVLLQRPLG